MFFVVTLASSAHPVAAQLPGGDTLSTLVRVARELRAHGDTWGASIWPGFRPDTITLAMVLPARGTLLLHHRGALPKEYVLVDSLEGIAFRPSADRGAASTGTSLGGRPVAQVVVNALDHVRLLPLALHETMHVFQRDAIREGRRFGNGEASWLVSRYPIFDADNEVGMALEGRVLASAIRAANVRDVRRLAREYVALRDRRSRRLEPDFATFEAMAELNEGLAEYAMVQGERFVGAETGRARLGRLDSLTAGVDRSIRLRFYATGSAIAALLDRLAGSAWKARMVAADRTLFEELAVTSGARDAERLALDAASTRYDRTRLAAETDTMLARVRRTRRATVDSLLHRDGLRIEIDASRLPGRSIGLCGFDPQNMLQVGDGSVLHTRWLKVCGGGLDGEFTTPVVQGAGAARLEALVGAGASPRWVADGAPFDPTTLSGARTVTGLRLESTTATFTVARADLERNGAVLRIRPVVP